MPATTKKPQIVIDQNKCIGCNTCCILNPDHFVMDEKTYKAKVKKQPNQITPDIKNTVDSCPVGAITLK